MQRVFTSNHLSLCPMFHSERNNFSCDVMGVLVPSHTDQAVLPSPQFTRRIGLLWNRLKRVKKLLGGWPKIGLLFIRLPTAALFFQICQFPVNSESLWTFSMSKNILFHQFQGLRHPGEQSTLIIHFMPKLTIVFSAQLGDYDYFTAEKHPNLENWALWLLDKNWAALKSLAACRKANWPRFGALKYWQHCD